MLLSDIRTYLKTKIECPQWYQNKLGGTQEQSITLYNVKGLAPRLALGGIENTSYSTKAISILIHWGKDSNAAERKAQEVYNAFFGQDAVIGNEKVIMFNMKTDSPVYVGTDSEGIIEYVVELIIYYERL